MNKIVIPLLSACIPAFLLTACYPDYVTDFDYTSVYFANQYDLRTFVIGEDEGFDAGVVLGGVISNREDRKVRIVIDDSLVDGDLSRFESTADLKDEDAVIEPFTAYQGMLGTAPIGNLMNTYVTAAFGRMPAGFSALTPLPASCYRIEGDPSNLCIAAGRHTATFRIRAESDALTADPKTLLPYYAIGLRIQSADADTVLLNKSFEIIAVRYENRFFGNWYHGGKAEVFRESGEPVETRVSPMPFPQDENELYVLSTEAANVLVTNRISFGQIPGSLRLTVRGNDIDVADADGRYNITPVGDGSRFNGAQLLQDRKIFLHYRIDTDDGFYTVVTDTLAFRNRIRDGINEWQDENPAHYE